MLLVSVFAAEITAVCAELSRGVAAKDVKVDWILPKLSGSELLLPVLVVVSVSVEP